VDQVDIDTIREYGEELFLQEVEQELRSRRYRSSLVRRVHIPKPGQPGKTRPLGIPTVEGPGGPNGSEDRDRTLVRGGLYSVLIRIPPEEDGSNGAGRDRRKRQ